MESKTHSYNNITYNNLELTVPNDLKFLILKSNLEQHNLRLWMSRLAYHTDKCSFTTKKKIMRERKRDREKKKGRERKRRKGHREREREKTEWERLYSRAMELFDFSVQKKLCKNHIKLGWKILWPYLKRSNNITWSYKIEVYFLCFIL